MAKRISPEKKAAVVSDFVRQGTSQRKLAVQFQLARGTVAKIVNKTMASPKSPSAIITFCDVPRYWCDDCKAWVTIEPCPACVARKTCGKSPFARVSESIEETPEVWNQPREQIPPKQVPEAVAEWFSLRLGKMIGFQGRREEVAEAVQEFSSQCHRLIEAIGNAMGESIREHYWREFKGR